MRKRPKRAKLNLAGGKGDQKTFDTHAAAMFKAMGLNGKRKSIEELHFNSGIMENEMLQNQYAARLARHKPKIDFEAFHQPIPIPLEIWRFGRRREITTGSES